MTKSLSDIEMLEKIPLQERNLPTSTYELVQRSAEQSPDKLALRFFLRGSDYHIEYQYRFEDLIININQAANMFHDLGIGESDVISFILPNLPHTWFTLVGGQTAGIVNPIDPQLEPAMMKEIMNAAGTKVLVTLAPFVGSDLWDTVASIADQVPTLESILQVNPANFLSFVSRSVGKFMTWRQGKRSVPQQVFDFDKKALDYPTDRLVSGREISPDDFASYVPTGDTAETLKLAERTHKNEVFSAYTTALALDVSSDASFYCGYPLFDVNGWILSGFVPWSRGATVVFGPPNGFRGRDVVEKFWEVVHYYEINCFTAPAPVFASLIDVPIHEAMDFASLEYAICAEPIEHNVPKQLAEKTGMKLLEALSLAEGTCLCAVNPPDGKQRSGSVGLRLPYQEIKPVILNDDGKYERDCDSGEVGIIVIRGEHVFLGYKNHPLSSSSWLELGDDGMPWFNTGIKARMDVDGTFWLEDTAMYDVTGESS